MLPIVMLIIGLSTGAIVVFLLFQQRFKDIAIQNKKLEQQRGSLREERTALLAQQSDFQRISADFDVMSREFNQRVVSYQELQGENTLLKRDLQNIDVNLRKLEMDTDLQNIKQVDLDAKIAELGARYLKENVKWIGKTLSPNNYAASKKKLTGVVERLRAVDFDIPNQQEEELFSDLKKEYEVIVRASIEREEQARIKAQIREEQRLEKEIERELKQLEREREAIQVALEKALSEAKDEHSEEVQRLRERLAEAEEKSQRAISQAQLTKSGHVYVISNIGSLGDGIFKIGMTRRLEPVDRIRELSSASVPFPFDVHMMISCDNAPALETSLHHALHTSRVNKTNPRKEFFRADIKTIHKFVVENHGHVDYVADPEALEYNQTLSMSDEDAEFIESIYESMEGDAAIVDDD